uniref:Formate dehydrogenase, mitochondrial n=1 Tax=Physcomitrium patens TaxID=3218 RepID=A0A7I4B448_PHYPA
MASRRIGGVLLAGSRALSRQHGLTGASAADSQILQRHLQFSRFSYSSAAQGGESKKILGVFFAAHEYAKNPEFLGCVENALGIREWLESKGHKYVVTSDKDGPDSELDKELADAHILITTPFHPAYMTKERLAKAKNLELLVTAGVGSDHIDLHAAAEKGLTVSEVTGSNVTSVAEDEVLRILVLVRNFAPGWKQVSEGGWNVAAVVHHAYDLIDRTVGTVGGGRIGQELMKRLKGFGLKEMLYYDRNSLGAEREKELGCKRETDLDTMLSKCDVVVVNTPLTDQTRGLFNKERIAKMKKGAYLVNNARGAIADTEAVKEACESGHLGGYGGDVWNAQPAGKDHPWRYMPNHAMTPHISGTTLDAQKRFAAGTKDMIDRWLKHEAFPEQNYIVREGKLASQYL